MIQFGNKTLIDSLARIAYEDSEIRGEMRFDELREEIAKKISQFDDNKYQTRRTDVTIPTLNDVIQEKYVISSFSDQQHCVELAKLILDSNGELKPFYKFYRETINICHKYDRDKLETEYNMAIVRAYVEIDFMIARRDKDILPNLQWLKSTHPNGCILHEKFYNHIWSIDDSFWDKHRPGEYKDCQCRLQATDTPATN